MLNVTFYTKNTETDKVSVTIQDKCQLETITSAKNFYADSDITDFSHPLPSLIDGEGMFKNCSNLTTFTSDLPSLVNGKNMFYYNTNLASFDGDLSNLQNGEGMFYRTNLASFNGDLSKLTNGECMFEQTALTEWNIDMPNLKNGQRMFYGADLASFSGDLSSLTNGDSMFSYTTALASFTGDLSSLANGSYMFTDTALESFSGDLSSLENGSGMFWGCKLNAPSVLNIVESINDEVVDAPLTIDIDCSSDMSDLNSFAQYVYYDNWHDLCRTFYDKGWSVTWGDTDGNSTIYTKYNDCMDISEVTAVDANYKTDLRNGEWVYLLDNLSDGKDIFFACKLTSWNIDLPSLTNGSNMFSYTTDLASFNGDLSSLTDGTCMFYGSALESFNGDLSSLGNGNRMFCEAALQSFNSNLSSLTNGYYMFSSSALTSFNSDLPSLTHGQNMFSYTTFESFNSDLSSLTNGTFMFFNNALTSFDGDLSSLTNGDHMFAYSAIQSFNGDLSSLVDGWGMFEYNQPRHYGITHYKMVDGTRKQVTETFVSNGLKSFISNLSSLKSGYYMFSSGNNATYTYTDDNGATVTETTKDIAPLDEESIMLIADTINDISSLNKSVNSDWTYTTCDSDGNLVTSTIYSNYRGVLHLGYDSSITDKTNIFKYCNEIVAKGWTVYLNGSSTQYDPSNPAALIDGEFTSTPIPHYYKPVQVTDEEIVEYVDGNGNYYIIVGAQHIFGDDISTYGMFTSYEHAVSEIKSSLGLTPYVKPTEE